MRKYWKGKLIVKIAGRYLSPLNASIPETTMLMELLSKAATVAMLSFVVTSMLAMGAGLTVSQISAPLRNTRLVAFALLANFVLMPLAALALAKVLWLDEPFGYRTAAARLCGRRAVFAKAR